MSGFKPSNRDLPKDRLATTDEQGRRVYLYPADVKGRFRKWRSIVHFILIVAFLILPWVKIGGHQALLLDIAHRRFAVFGITFWAHDAPMLVFIFGGAALTLGLITAIWGRIWCGWACPQTVFIDSVFRAIERRIEGDHLARKALDQSPITLSKAAKKTLKWSAFTAVTLLITHSFLAYFVGTETLAEMIRKPPQQNLPAFLTMLFITSAILFDFGWFREQFCTVVCPYGRFQSILMDEHSMIVVYDEKRPDCVNCFRCVQVCPTGIDIRRGTQLECIGCTACIDACDDVMSRIHKPLGLIRYDSAAGLQNKPSKTIRARTLLYVAMITIALSGLAFNLITRGPIDVALVRAADTPYQIIQTSNDSDTIINRFKVDLSNQSFYDITLYFKAYAKTGEQQIEVVSAQNTVHIKAGQKVSQDVFFKFPKSLLESGKANALFSIESDNGKRLTTEEVTLVGPYL